MAQKALFSGLIVDENDHPVGTVMVGGEANYVVDDAGFKRHIPSEEVDRQVLEFMRSQIKGKEDLISEQTAEMLGQDDPFTRAAIENQLKQIDQQFDALMNAGIPEEGRAYMGMLGFRVIINMHGEVIEVVQPSAPGSDEE
jgi:hypothetical protein